MFDDDPIHSLVHLHVDGAFSRRELIDRVIRHTGSVAAAMAALGGYEELRGQTAPPPVPAGVRVAIDDPAIDAADVTFPGPDSVLYGHYAAPKKLEQDPQPGVLVIHENRGLVEHIKDVTRRAAKAGFAALSVDLLSRQGGVQAFPDPTQQTAAYNRTTQFQRRSDIIGALDYLKRQPGVIHDRIGIVGFCAGGGNVWDFAINVSELVAGVAFYGAPVPAVADIGTIQAAMLAIYAERDRALTRSILPVADAMVAQSKTFGLSVYEGVGHAFHNDTGAAYEPVAAQDAWTRTIAHFNKFLRRPRS
jgi:carboxymethylenebutenolidase